MRFHTRLTREEMLAVPLPPGVEWYRLKESGSRSRDRKFDMILTGGSNRGGQYGAQDYAAATWDEWGVVLGALFELDPNARVPHTYEGIEDFHWSTGDRYHPDELPALCPRHRWDFDWGRPREHECRKCGAIRRWHSFKIGDLGPHHYADTLIVYTITAADFLAGDFTRRTPVTTDRLGHTRSDLGKYASDGKYAADLEANPIPLLDRIDELLKG